MASAGQGWRPTTFLRFEIALDTSMETARLVTDAGLAYLKALGNRQGPHPLAGEWVGTQVAGFQEMGSWARVLRWKNRIGWLQRWETRKVKWLKMMGN
jgi:hypothetical protein